MKVGDWVIATDGETPPGKITCVNSEYVIFEIFDSLGSYETHRSPQNVRPASKIDFDRFVLNLSAEMLRIEELIDSMEKAQEEVP